MTPCHKYAYVHKVRDGYRGEARIHLSKDHIISSRHYMSRDTYNEALVDAKELLELLVESEI